MACHVLCLRNKYLTTNLKLLSKTIKLIKYQVAFFFSRPTASEVLTAYLTQCNEPPWTSYFVKVLDKY